MGLFKKIVDIGCGGGRNAGELLKKYPDSKVKSDHHKSKPWITVLARK